MAKPRKPARGRGGHPKPPSGKFKPSLAMEEKQFYDFIRGLVRTGKLTAEQKRSFLEEIETRKEPRAHEIDAQLADVESKLKANATAGALARYLEKPRPFRTWLKFKRRLTPEVMKTAEYYVETWSMISETLVETETLRRDLGAKDAHIERWQERLKKARKQAEVLAYLRKKL